MRRLLPVAVKGMMMSLRMAVAVQMGMPAAFFLSVYRYSQMRAGNTAFYRRLFAKPYAGDA